MLEVLLKGGEAHGPGQGVRINLAVDNEAGVLASVGSVCPARCRRQEELTFALHEGLTPSLTVPTWSISYLSRTVQETSPVSLFILRFWFRISDGTAIFAWASGTPAARSADRICVSARSLVARVRSVTRSCSRVSRRSLRATSDAVGSPAPAPVAGSVVAGGLVAGG